MKLPDLVEMASGNLRNSLLRNGLTTSGIAVGIASLVVMLSLGVGLQELAGQRLSRSGLFNTVVVSAWRDADEMAREGGPGVLARGDPRVLDEAARQEIEQIPNVEEALPEIRFVGEIRRDDKSYITSVGGLPLSARDDEAFDTLQGKFFSGPQAAEAIVKLDFAREQDASNPSSLLGQEVVLRYAERAMLAPEEDTGDGSSGLTGETGTEGEEYGFTVVRREQTLRVVGIVEEDPYGGMRAVSRVRVYLPTGLVENLNIMQQSDLRGAVQAERMQKTYPSLMTRVSNPARVAEVQNAIRSMGFETFSILNAARSLQRFFIILDLFLGIFGSMALAVASLGIVNTLVMAVLERRREIGIMKALGASDRDIKRLFFAEAGTMGLFGGIVGVAIGWAMSSGINWGTAYYLRQRDFPPETVSSVPLWLVGAAIGFAVAVSLAAGMYPAARAAKLDPVQAIRYE
jgi:putative ABC transport system permease protein